MGAPRFLVKTSLEGFAPLELDGQPVLASHARIVAALAARGCAAAARLFAEPVIGGDAISWYGEGGGEPVPIDALPAARRADAEERLAAALGPAMALLDDAELGPLLRRAIVLGDASHALALDDAVVLAGWGLAPRGLADDAARARHGAATLERIAPGLAARATGPAPQGGGAGAIPPGPPSRPTMPVQPPVPARPVAAAVAGWWLGPLLALVALAFLGLGLWLAWTHLARDMAGRRFVAQVVDEERTRRALEAQHEANAALERELARAREAARRDVCVAEAPPQRLPALPAQQAKPAQQPEPPAPPPQQPQAPQRCTAAQVPAQVILAMDTSGSMRFPAGNRPDILELERRLAAGDVLAMLQLDASKLEQGPKRMDEAKVAARDFVGSLPPAARLGIVSFDGACGAQVDLAPTTDRGRARRIVERFSGNGGTPIGATLRRVRALLDADPDPDIPRTVVFVSDGHETCQGDPCGEAAALAAAYPKLRIHVIDVTGTSELECVARATGGTIVQTKDLAGLKDAVARAATDVGRRMECPEEKPAR